MGSMPPCPVCSNNDKVTCSIDPVIAVGFTVLNIAVPLWAWPIRAGLPQLPVTYFCSRDGHRWIIVSIPRQSRGL
jgi:hypothetical protein